MSAFEIVRRAQISADPARVHDLVNDFRHWREWSPWEDLDPDLNREYDGPDSGVGATYRWSGNRKAGAGSMEITESSPERVAIRVNFLKPFRSENRVTFDIVPAAEGADVSWAMAGEQKGLVGVVAKVFSMEKYIAKDFDKGLGRLKSLAEA
ncbi:MAG: SRPBCC family protein [Nocardioides sp.]|uniref:SRPBCC family protein n=1 Tax=Nocardioides sp. TaxID=35761 RepID=UPI0039E6205B